MLITVAVLGVTVEQSELSWTKPKGKRVFISCRVTDLTTDYIHWYQQKDDEALKRILYIKHDGSGLTYNPNHPQAREFTVKVDRSSNIHELRVDTLKTSHSAVYYCACWERGSHSDSNTSHPVQKL
uniref:Ig-like domain-containing protein n=1 Tax=Pygocentrus nattereri TaxID=42514 RepID=A0A3B4D710_PYGNA